MTVSQWLFCIGSFAIISVVASPARAQAKYDVDTTFDSDGVKIHYVIKGKGEPVLLIHGYTASAALNWGVPGVIDVLAPNYQVIAIDNRGHGLSDKPTDEADYGTKMVDDSLRLLDHLKIEKANIIGYSMGGMIALKMLTTHPERVKSAVIGGMGWIKEEKSLRPPPAETPANEQQRVLSACRRSFGRLGISEEELKAIKVPMTVVIGDKDGILTRNVKPLSAARPDVPVVIVPGATHMNAFARTEFKDALKDFLAKQSGKPEPTVGAAGENK